MPATIFDSTLIEQRDRAVFDIDERQARRGFPLYVVERCRLIEDAITYSDSESGPSPDALKGNLFSFIGGQVFSMTCNPRSANDML